MWNLTPDYLQQVKEELKGRRAAIEARIADELKTISSDLEDIETLERAAYSFATKHLAEPNPAERSEGPAVEVAPLEPAPVEQTGEEPVVQPEPETKPLSRWRVRARAENE